MKISVQKIVKKYKNVCFLKKTQQKIRNFTKKLKKTQKNVIISGFTDEKNIKHQ